MLIPRHSLVCFIFSPRYARLAADVSQQAASLRWYRGSCSWVAILTQPQQIGVRYKVSTFSALPGHLPVQFLHGGKVKGLAATCATCFTERKKLCNIHILHPGIATWTWHSVGEAMHDSTREVWQNKSCRRHQSTLELASCFLNLSPILDLYFHYINNKQYIIKNTFICRQKI